MGWLDAVKKAFATKHIHKTIKATRSGWEDEESHIHHHNYKKRRWIFKKASLHVHETTILHQESSAVPLYYEIHGNSTTNAAVSLHKHKAVLVIQTSFRAYLARRAVEALRGVVKLQALVRGHIVRKRAKMTLKCIQALLRVQARVCHQRTNLFNQPTSTFHSNSIYVTHEREGGRLGTNYWDRNAYKNIEDIQAGLLHKTQVASQSPRKDASLIHQFRRWEENQSVEKDWEWDRQLSLDQPQVKIKIDDNTCPRPQNETYHYHQHRFDSISSPMSPSSYSRIKPSHPHQRQEAERNLKPGYMSATASAMARIRPQSAPRHRKLSTTDHQGDKKTSARKRLSFNLSADRYNYNCGSISDSEVRSPRHMTDETRLSMSSCRKHRVEDEISRPSVCQPVV